MKKTKTSKTVSTLPADFSTDENVISSETKQPPTPVAETPTAEIPVIASETEKSATSSLREGETDAAIHTDSTDSPLPIPEIDQDAELKIDEVQMQSEELPEQEKHGKSLFILGSIIAVIILAGAIILSALYLKTPEEKSTVAQATPTPTISETPKPELIKADFNFEILNASGISGQAGKTQIIVEDAGYKVDSVGNANSRETGTKLLIDKSLVSQKDLLIADLQKILPGIIYGGEFASDTANARIIIGE